MLEKEIERIILSEKDVIPFLRKLSPKDKRALAPFLKKLHKKITEIKYVETKSGLYGSYTSVKTHSDKQRDGIEKACFVCLNKTDVKRTLFNVSSLAVDDYYVENIIPWYKPKWLSEVVNEDIPWNLSYSKLMGLKEKGLIEVSSALIVAKLPNAIVEMKYVNDKHVCLYQTEVLLQYKETLEKHIWILFEEESNINNYYNYLNLENYKDGSSVWIDTIVDLVFQNKLSRKKVLIACIYSSTKGFNKTLSGWFFDLLIKLAPSQDEVLSLQDEFFTGLNSPHSKVVNTVLKYFKQVANGKKFKSKVFVENASILLNSETKSVVNSTLMILDKIAKTQKSLGISICEKAAEALLSVDEKIQLRASKVIAKYGNPQKQQLLDELSLYADSLFHSSKEVLKEFLSFSEEVEEETYEVEEVEILSSENELAKYDSLDDLIFFVSQSIDNNELYHIDLLLSYLPKISAHINKANVTKLEPIFKRSLDLVVSQAWNGQIGNLETKAACLINDFAEIMLRKYPVELAKIQENKDLKTKEVNSLKYNRPYYINILKNIENQQIADYAYQIHHSLFIKSKSLLKKGLTLDLLSLPTHIPCWIKPSTLIERIISFEKSNEELDLYDFQVAIGRLPLNKYTSEDLLSLNEIQDTQIKKVLQYHFDQLTIQQVHKTRPELWIQSVLTKNNFEDLKYFQEQLRNPLQKELGLYEWECKSRDHFYKDYDYTTRQQVQKKMIVRELKFKNFNNENKAAESLLSGIKGIFNKKPIKVSSIYEFMHFRKQEYFTHIDPNDSVRFLFLAPNNPSRLLSNIIHNSFKESNLLNETDKRNTVNLLKGLYEVWNRDDFTESSYLFLATCLLCNSKVARELAAEIWIKTNSENNIDNSLLGEVLGKLEAGEYAPLKRFTDLISNSIFNVSKRHNECLYSLLDNMLGKMNNQPIRGTKKLLEIYLELKLNFPEVGMSELSKESLLNWSETSSLKALINKIEKK